MKKVIFVAGALALSGCSYILPQSSQTMHYQCGTTPLTVALDGKASEVSLLMDGEPAASQAGAGADRRQIQRRQIHFLVERP